MDRGSCLRRNDAVKALAFNDLFRVSLKVIKNPGERRCSQENAPFILKYRRWQGELDRAAGDYSPFFVQARPVCSGHSEQQLVSASGQRSAKGIIGLAFPTSRITLCVPRCGGLYRPATTNTPHAAKPQAMIRNKKGHNGRNKIPAGKKVVELGGTIRMFRLVAHLPIDCLDKACIDINQPS